MSAGAPAMAVPAPIPWDEASLRAILAPPYRPIAAGAVPAAVLVPLIAHPAGVLLTRRAASLRNHAGQVAFPGGRIDATDASPEAAALREAEEEIGLNAADITLLGRLPALRTGTGYHVIPIVGLLHTLPPLRLCAEEVAATFVLPRSVLDDPPERRQATFDGVSRSFWVWPHEHEYIWGATAAILRALAEGVRRPGALPLDQAGVFNPRPR